MFWKILEHFVHILDHGNLAVFLERNISKHKMTHTVLDGTQLEYHQTFLILQDLFQDNCQIGSEQLILSKSKMEVVSKTEAL